MTRHIWTPEPDALTSAEQPEMSSRGRGRSLALIVHSGHSPIEVLPSYHNHNRRLDSTVSFNSVWINGYNKCLEGNPIKQRFFTFFAPWTPKSKKNFPGPLNYQITLLVNPLIPVKVV